MAPCKRGNRKRRTVSRVHLLCKHTRRKRILPTPFKVWNGFVKFPKSLDREDPLENEMVTYYDH